MCWTLIGVLLSLNLSRVSTTFRYENGGAYVYIT